MKWTENGVTFDGTVEEYKELHADGYAPQLKRTRAGKRITVIDGEKQMQFPTIKAAAECIGRQTGRYVAATTLGRMMDEAGTVKMDCFRGGASLFESESKATESEGSEEE